MNDSNIYLCSFASDDLKLSKFRFLDQAEKMNIYKKIKVFSHDDLNEKIKKQIKSFFDLNQKRLYGYACWKSYIIKEYLTQIPKNSILQYSDIGCEFNPKGFDRLKEYLNLCNKYNILTFQYKPPDKSFDPKLKYQRYFEYQYTKEDLFNFFDISNKNEHKYSEQIWSGTIFFKNNDYSNNILDKWSELLNISNFIDDSESKIENHEDFVEHRHDQSVFSLICKKNNIFSLSASECEWAEYANKRTWDHLYNYPIHAKRNKKYNFIKRFINRQKRNLNRLFNK